MSKAVGSPPAASLSDITTKKKPQRFRPGVVVKLRGQDLNL